MQSGVRSQFNTRQPTVTSVVTLYTPVRTTDPPGLRFCGVQFTLSTLMRSELEPTGIYVSYTTKSTDTTSVQMYLPQFVHPVAAPATATRARIGRALRKRFMMLGFAWRLREARAAQMVAAQCSYIWTESSTSGFQNAEYDLRGAIPRIAHEPKFSHQFPA